MPARDGSSFSKAPRPWWLAFVPFLSSPTTRATLAGCRKRNSFSPNGDCPKRLRVWSLPREIKLTFARVYNVNYAWVSSSIPRPRAKRAASLAIVNLMSGGATHFYTSYLFPDNDKPRYYMGGSVLTVAVFLCATTAIVIRFCLIRLNRKIDRLGGHAESAVQAASGGTLTQKAFRFTL